MSGNRGSSTPLWMWYWRISVVLFVPPMLVPEPNWTLEVSLTVLMSPLTILPMMLTGVLLDRFVDRTLPMAGSQTLRLRSSWGERSRHSAQGSPSAGPA